MFLSCFSVCALALGLGVSRRVPRLRLRGLVGMVGRCMGCLRLLGLCAVALLMVGLLL